MNKKFPIIFSRIFSKILLNLFLLFLPSLSFGQIIFSEIMYDPAGTDAGYEWVEIYNTSQYSVNLEDYKFCEGSPTCHSWAAGKNTNFVIDGKGFAIVTDDREKFLEKNSFSGLVLVSTGFTLTNTGELVQIKNKEGNLDDSLTYNPVSGGGNGQSLSVFAGLWKNSESTPGEENVEKQSSGNSGGSGDSGGSGNSSSSSQNINTSYVEVSSDMFLGKKKLRAEIDDIGIVMAGARAKFSGKAYGITGVEISGIEFLWNFGDGAKGKGQSDFHEYDFPSEYIVTLIVKSGNFTGNKKVRIKVIDPKIEISEVFENTEKTGFIKIKNKTDYVLNLENWMLSVDGERFLIPGKTYIDKNAEIIFSNKITHLLPINTKIKKSRVALLFPNGDIFQSFDWQKFEVEKAEKIKKEVGKDKKDSENKQQQGSTLINSVDGKSIKAEEKISEPAGKKQLQKSSTKKTKKKSKKRKSKKVYKLPAGAYLKSQSEIENKTANIGFADKRNLANNLPDENIQRDRQFTQLNQSASISKSNFADNFIKQNWPFLTFIFILFSLISGILYIKKDEFLAEDESNERKEKEGMDIMEDVKKEAEEFEIEEILEK